MCVTGKLPRWMEEKVDHYCDILQIVYERLPESRDTGANIAMEIMKLINQEILITRLTEAIENISEHNFSVGVWSPDSTKIKVQKID